MQTPIEKIDEILMLAERIDRPVLKRELVKLFHSFALELAEGVEGKLESDVCCGACDIDEGYTKGINSAATFIREAVKTDE